jgi:hypothetical protein
MGNEKGQYKVYAIEPIRSRGPQFIVTTLYRTPPTPSADSGTDRAEWFVVSADDPEPLRAHDIGFGDIPLALKVQITDEALLKAAFDEAVTEVRDHEEVGKSADLPPKDRDLLVSYWIRGRCTEELEEIAKRTRCPALRTDLDSVFTLPKLSKTELTPSESDTP